MSTDPSTIEYFSVPERRVDNWVRLNRLAGALQKRPDDATLHEEAAATLAAMQPLEELNGYPGPRLLGQVRERLNAGDWTGFQRLTQRISGALLSNSYRESPEVWGVEEEGEGSLLDILPPTLGRGQSRRPYFEVLIVSPDDRATWPEMRQLWRQMQREQDPFVYEPVVVGSLEDALLATIFNYNLQAVVIVDGFDVPSHYGETDLREILAQYVDMDQAGPDADLGVTLAGMIHDIRPELDIYLVSDQDVAALAGSEEAAAVRRVFYGMEEPMEIHISIMDGINDRYRTPHFDNLKRYALRPIGTFHALPIARGKSVFKSNWIRDMGEFYGVNIFLAESSATTGGLDSLLSPRGNIMLAQQAAARAFGGERSFFVTNGTSTSNKIVHQGLLLPGDIVLIDRQCHKSHHYGLMLCGAQPLYIDAYPLTEFSMYGAVPIKRIKAALLQLKAEGKLDRAKMLVLTNCTFDGHMSHVERTMMECLAIKPDMIFLWDEAWSGFARFSPFLRMRTAMGAAAAIRKKMGDPAYRQQYEAFRAEYGDLDPADERLLDVTLLPDPDKVRIRVYETDSVHKSMSCLRQGSIIVVDDQEFHTVEAAFKEAFHTHTSTSPNHQIIASLDLARRQMELEGYELVSRAVQLAVDLRREVNNHPLISKYFHITTPAEMIPEAYRQSGFTDFNEPGLTLADTVRALEEDEFFLDPTRVTLLCGRAGYDGTGFRALLTDEYDIQINKTSRNSVLVQFNINNTRSDVAHLIRSLADMARKLDKRLAEGGEAERAAFAARVKSLVEDVPDLPDFSIFHDAFRDDPNSATKEGHMREAYFLANDPANTEYILLNSEEIDRRLEEGPPLVSAKFVVPYPPGFPIIVPGQIITREIVDFMRKLDVKEIHGYSAARGLELLTTEALAKAAANRR